MQKPNQIQIAECKARFPRSMIQNFGFASVGLFTLSLNADGLIFHATAPLHDATYKQLVIDDPQILNVFAASKDSSYDLIFPPMTRFRLDPITDSDKREDSPWPDTARLVDVSNLPALAAQGHRSVTSLEPPRGAVHARLEALWGVSIDVKQLLAEQKLKSSAVQPDTSNLPVKLTSDSEGAATPSFLVVKSSTESGSLQRLQPSPVRFSPARPATHAGSTEHHQNRSSEITDADVTAVLEASVSDHGCVSRRVCSVCRETPSLPWLTMDANGTEMAKVLVQINNRLSQAARFEYGGMYNLERCTVAKKSKETKQTFQEKLRKFVIRWDIEELHNRFATLQCNNARGAYRLPRFDAANQQS